MDSNKKNNKRPLTSTTPTKKPGKKEVLSRTDSGISSPQPSSPKSPSVNKSPSLGVSLRR
jgi:hypothetical protein